jgi:flagellar motor switch protein FliN/FliY
VADPTDNNDEISTDSAAQAGDASSGNAPTAVTPTEQTDQSNHVGNNDAETKVQTDNIEKLLAEASQNLEQAVDGSAASSSNDRSPKPYALGDLTPISDANPSQPIDLFGEVEMDLRVELGRTRMRLEEVLQLRGGSVVALDKLAGDPVDIFVNGRLIARGEVLVMNDNFCIRVTELVGT